MLIRTAFILIIFFHAISAYSRNIVVIDDVGKSIQQAVVAIQGLGSSKVEFAITDTKGKVNIAYPDTPVFIRITHVSYQTYVDTLYQPNETIEIILESMDVRLNEVVITSEYLPRTSDQIVHSTRIISKEEISARAANSLDELLESEAGIRITQDNILGSGMTMNGLSGQNIKFLVDGVPVIGRLDGDIDISQLLLNDVERIEIINGPMSAMYGTDASGGVVNIISKPPSSTSLSGGAHFYHESSGHYNVDGFLGSAWNRSSIKISGGRNFFQGWSTTDTGRYDEWKPKEQYFGSINYRYTANKYSIGLKSDILNETVTNLGHTKVTPYYAYAFDEYYKTKRFTNTLNASYMVGPYQGASISIARSDYIRTKNTWRKDMVSLEDELIPESSMHDTTIFSAWNIRASYGNQEEDQILNYQAGFDVKLEKAKGSRFKNETESIEDYALFATLEYKASDKLVIQPAVRMAYNTNYKAPVVPSMSFLYHISKSLQIRFSYGRGFRAPGIKELYLYFVDINHNIQGNEELLPEYSDNFYVAINHTLSNDKKVIISSLGFFHNSIRNMITLAQPDLSNSLYTYINIGKFSTHGVNFNNEVKYNSLSAGVGFSYTGRYNIYADSGDFKNYIYNPDITFKVGYHVDKIGFSANLIYKYSGKLPGYKVDDDNSVSQFYNDSYNIMDFVVRKSLFNGTLAIGGGVKNIFDVTNISAVSVNGAHTTSSNSMAVGTGRSLFINLKIALAAK